MAVCSHCVHFYHLFIHWTSGNPSSAAPLPTHPDEVADLLHCHRMLYHPRKPYRFSTSLDSSVWVCQCPGVLRRGWESRDLKLWHYSNGASSIGTMPTRGSSQFPSPTVGEHLLLAHTLLSRTVSRQRWKSHRSSRPLPLSPLCHIQLTICQLPGPLLGSLSSCQLSTVPATPTPGQSLCIDCGGRV